MQDFDDVPIIDLSEQIIRERIFMPNLPHIWWGRTPDVIAHAAVLASLMPQSDEFAHLLGRLGVYLNDDAAIESAKQSIAAEFQSAVEQESNQQRLRLLDPFSGSGSIPLAANRFGVEAYAIDVNPVSYILQLCRITFPQRFGKADQRFRGTDKDGNWAGLATEVRYWSEWLDTQVQAEVHDLYPALTIATGDQVTPQAYFWTYSTDCENSSCMATFPLINSPYLAKKPSRSIALYPSFDDNSNKVSLTVEPVRQEQKPAPTVQRGKAVCPVCGTIKDLQSDSDIQVSQLIALLIESDAGHEYIENALQQEIQINKAILTKRIEILLQDTAFQPLDEPLPDLFAVHRYGFRSYSDIFTNRQLLFLLTVAKFIPVAHGQMLSRGYEAERATAVTTYLGLLLSNLVNDHNMLCQWQATRERSLPVYTYLRPPVAWVYVELNPLTSAKSLGAHTDRLTRVIDVDVDTEVPVHVKCASAISLPYPDAFFDGIVTAAPYYDAIPYAALSDIYFIWLKRAIGHLYLHEFGSDLTPKADEIVIAGGPAGKVSRQKDITDYYTKLDRALAEVERVLKPGCFFIMLIPLSRADALQKFLGIAQSTGLDLMDAKRIQTSPTRPEDSDVKQYQTLLTFRKSKLVQQASQAIVNAATVLRLADESKPVLCSGLAYLLMENLEQEDWQYLIPSDYSGPLENQLVEYIYSCEDPGDLLLKQLGLSKLRKIATDRGLSIASRDPKDAILDSLGFSIPEPEQVGLDALVQDLPRKISVVKISSPEKIRGIYLTAATEFESLLKRTIWAWGELVFGTERDTQLSAIVGKDLNKLSMGDYKSLFFDLPNHIVSGHFQEHVRQQLHRDHLYSTKKLTGRFDKIVALRNRIAHNKDEYLTTSPLAEICKEVQDGLEEIKIVLTDLKSRKAVPLIVRPVRKTLDVFGRCSYELKHEDGAVTEAYMTEDLELGRDYYFFWSGTNPRPVDPPMLLVSAILDDLP